jgi:redox-sensitive bicupin YhaK (pirin superfamily)
MKRVKKIIHAERDDIADLITFRAMPVAGLTDLNPFIFLNHHGPQTYVENNHGLPFGPHPHRGFETVTFILEGDIAHRDSTGTESVITEGGVQWMTAGRGIVHSEVSSEHFKRAGGPMEILQLWVNLPARLKMSEPWYLGLQKHQIPRFERDAGKVNVQLVSGKWEDNLGPIPTLRPTSTMLISMKDNAAYAFEVPEGERIFFYVVSGFISVNGTKAGPRETVTFHDEGTQLEVTTEKGARILFCHAPPLDEPIVSYGPFVMNTMDEIKEAIQDFQSGKFE